MSELSGRTLRSLGRKKNEQHEKMKLEIQQLKDLLEKSRGVLYRVSLCGLLKDYRGDEIDNSSVMPIMLKDSILLARQTEKEIKEALGEL